MEPELVSLHPGLAAYPLALTRCQPDAPPTVTAWGNVTLLQHPLLGFFCSIRCPGDSLLATYDLARALRDAGIAVIGGFHSPMEKECLTFLLRGTQPVVICPVRSLEGMRLPSVWRPALREGRLLLLSPFAPAHRRITGDLAQRRNLFVAALAGGIFVSHAASGSKTEELARQTLAWGKPVWALDCPSNQHLPALGAQLTTPTTAAEVWRAYQTTRVPEMKSQ
jgi:predicted Rossmann fold nucleotide-binding protein DprA/Smf involved in DNA uptake